MVRSLVSSARLFSDPYSWCITDQFYPPCKSSGKDSSDEVVRFDAFQGKIGAFDHVLKPGSSLGVICTSTDYTLTHSQEKTRAVRELTASVLARPPKMCNFIEWRDKKVIYKRWVFARNTTTRLGRLLMSICICVKVRLAVLHRLRGPRGQRAHHPRADPPLRRGA
jgi:hypothetical protein